MSDAQVEKANSVALVISSCDAYSDMWPPFFDYFFRNWSHCPFQIYLITNHKTFIRPGVHVVRVGEDRSYAENLHTALDKIEADWLLLWLDDVFISKPVDNLRLLEILSYADSLKIPFIQLSPDLPISYECKDADIAPLPFGVRYRSAVGINFIKKDLLLKIATPGLSAWDMDRSDLCDQLSISVYALTKRAAQHPPIEYLHAVAKGRWIRKTYPRLKRDGFDKVLQGRKIQPFFEHIYFRLYALRSQLYKILSLYWR